MKEIKYENLVKISQLQMHIEINKRKDKKKFKNEVWNVMLFVSNFRSCFNTAVDYLGKKKKNV